MNIFILDKDIKKCAKYHCDKHVVKMILETAQMLCVVRRNNWQEPEYRSTHKNHPCTIRAWESLSNYKWLCELWLQLCYEYTLRYDRVHRTQSVIDSCIKNTPKIKDKWLTKFPMAMPDEYKCSNPIEAYRKYYSIEKASIAKRQYCEKPERFIPSN